MTPPADPGDCPHHRTVPADKGRRVCQQCAEVLEHPGVVAVRRIRAELAARKSGTPQQPDRSSDKGLEPRT